MGILIIYGSTELGTIVDNQQGASLYGLIPNWGIFVQPLGAALFFVAATAENKRVPFDLPECESEIVGFFLEYSSMGFGLFMLAEFIEVVVLSSLFVTLFLGGWQLPWIMGDGTVWLGFTVTSSPIVYGLVGVLVFALKTVCVCLISLQIRWTLPRFHYDQLMRLG